MILVDANVLVYAHVDNFPQHPASRAWLDARWNGPPRTVGLPWPTIFAFLRLVTNPRMFAAPLSAAEAWRSVAEWLVLPQTWIPAPGRRHEQLVGELIGQVRPSSKLMPDLHLAAIALEHGLMVASTDADFARFPGVTWQNPLTAH